MQLKPTHSKPLLSCFLTAFLALLSNPARAANEISFPDFAPPDTHKHTAADDEEVHSCAIPPPPFKLRRASNLSAAGHYEEAYSDCSELPESKADKFWTKIHYGIWGHVCEQLGRKEEALKRYKQAGSNEDIAKWYLNAGKFWEARVLADSMVVDSAKSEREGHGESYKLAEWLRIRAIAENGLHEYGSAVRDLTEAATKYSKHDSVLMNLCIREANQLKALHSLGQPINPAQLQLPRFGAERLIALVTHLASSTAPFDCVKINKIAGCRLKMPGEYWPQYSEDDKPSKPFWRVEYHSNSDDYHIPELVEFKISTNDCCISRDEIVSVLPGSATPVKSASYWTNMDESDNVESFNLNGITLKFYYSDGRSKILKQIAVSPIKAERNKTAEDWYDSAKRLDDDLDERKVEFLSKSIALDDSTIDAYILRAKALSRLGRKAEALSDVKVAVSMGGRPYLVELAKIEARFGDFDSAIHDLQVMLDKHAVSYETVDYYSLLAEFFCQHKNYKKAFEICQKAKVYLRETAAIDFIKAKAEFGLGMLTESRRDAKHAAQQYFEQARIVRRDEVLTWLKTLPSAAE